MFRRIGDVYLAHSAVVSADVTLARGVSVWFGVSIRGDVAPITIGEYSNIQDNAVVHCDFGFPNVIEPEVVVGHSAVLHGIRVGSGSLIGIGAKLLGGTDIGEECLIAAGAVVPPGMKVPPRSVVMGTPGKLVRAATPDEIARTKAINLRYRELARRYADGEIAWPYGTADSAKTSR
jgi:carbonic anhydrase/acetyltransferase-like protein (isoleucine patch superfamily)